MDRNRINMTIKIIDEKGELIASIKDWDECTDEELIAREAHVSSQVGKNPYAEDYLEVIHKEMKRRSL